MFNLLLTVSPIKKKQQQKCKLITKQNQIKIVSKNSNTLLIIRT